jgi:opacity protein-like surface antigen
MKIMLAPLAALLATCLTAEAQRLRPRDTGSNFYLFGEYDYYSDTSSTSSSGGGLGGGWNFNRYLGLQGGGQYLTKSGIDLTNIYAEVKLSWPLANNFSVYGSIGGAYARASGTVTFPTLPPTSVSVTNTATGYRAGVGAEYWLGEHWGLRAGFHRQNAGGVADDISAGIVFRF